MLDVLRNASKSGAKNGTLNYLFEYSDFAMLESFETFLDRLQDRNLLLDRLMLKFTCFMETFDKGVAMAGDLTVIGVDTQNGSFESIL